MPKSFNAFVIASAIIKRGDQFLVFEEERLGQRLLNFPGGRMCPNEIPSETAAREAQEETGLTIRITNLVAVTQGTWADGGLFAKFIFEAEALGGHEQAEKTATIHWLTKEQILDPAQRPAPFLAVDEAAIIEYLSERQSITPFFYRFDQERGFFRADLSS